MVPQLDHKMSLGVISDLSLFCSNNAFNLTCLSANNKLRVGEFHNCADKAGKFEIIGNHFTDCFRRHNITDIEHSFCVCVSSERVTATP